MSSVPSSPFHGVFKTLGSKIRLNLEEHSLDESSDSQRSLAPSRGQLALDIYQEEGYLVIKAPIAGVNLSDLDIEVHDNVITISGRRQNSDTIPASQYYLRECYWGDFRRSVTLPFTPTPSRVQATFDKEGILKITVPREEKVKIVKINEGG